MKSTGVDAEGGSLERSISAALAENVTMATPALKRSEISKVLLFRTGLQRLRAGIITCHGPPVNWPILSLSVLLTYYAINLNRGLECVKTQDCKDFARFLSLSFQELIWLGNGQSKDSTPSHSPRLPVV